MPLGYEVFAGNRHDATTLEEIVAHMEDLYGRAGRVWIMDRGLASEKNVQFLRAGGRRYILGTAKNSLRKTSDRAPKDPVATARHEATRGFRTDTNIVETSLCPP